MAERLGTNKEYKERLSRCKDWKDFKALEDWKDYRRSRSNPGMWKNPNGQYCRAPDRTPSRPNRKDFESPSDESDNDEDSEQMKEIVRKIIFFVTQMDKVKEQQEIMSEENKRLKSLRKSNEDELKRAKEEIKEKEKELEEMKQNLEVCTSGLIALRF
jgi:septin family protein